MKFKMRIVFKNSKSETKLKIVITASISNYFNRWCVFEKHIPSRQKKVFNITKVFIRFVLFCFFFLIFFI